MSTLSCYYPLLKQNWNKYFKDLIYEADDGSQSHINQLNNSYSLKEELNQDCSSDLIIYYNNLTGKYAKKHLEKLRSIGKYFCDKANDVNMVDYYGSHNIHHMTAFKKSIKLYKKSIRAGYSKAWYHMGRLYDIKFKYKKALDSYMKYIRTGDKYDLEIIHSILGMISNSRSLRFGNLIPLILKEFFSVMRDNEHLKEEIIHLKYQPGGLGFKKVQKRNSNNMKI